MGDCRFLLPRERLGWQAAPRPSALPSSGGNLWKWRIQTLLGDMRMEGYGADGDLREEQDWPP